jgi:hypothetical protein
MTILRVATPLKRLVFKHKIHRQRKIGKINLINKTDSLLNDKCSGF